MTFGRAQSGMSLVEMLVAMLVLSIGLLGIASLFLHELGNTRAALLRTQAIDLVDDMMDRIRANAAARGAYDLARYGGAPATQGCTHSDSGESRDCSRQELAEDDLAHWQSAVRRALPATASGLQAARVEFLGGEPARYRVGVAWQEPGESLPFTFDSDLLLEGMP